MNIRMHRLLGTAALSGLLLTACGQSDLPAELAPVADPPSSPAAPPDSFTVVATGDFLSQPELSHYAGEQAQAAGRAGHDFTGVLATLKPMVSAADLAICHMETPLATVDGPFTGYPIFNAPPGLADSAAELGYDTCSTASNHTVDYGAEGLIRTLDELDRVGIRHAGSARTEQEAGTPTILDVNGIPVAHLSYTFSFNGLNLPDGMPWAANLLERDRVLADARRAKEAGAEVVILSLQWGTEYQHAADIGQTGLAQDFLTSPDIDLIIGHHVHVVQPFEKIGGKWVAYGIGNVMVRFPDGSPESTQDALAARFTFHREGAGWTVRQVEVLPTWMEYYPVPRIVDLPAELTGSGRPEYQRAYDRVVHWVNARGAGQDGLTILGSGSGSGFGGRADRAQRRPSRAS